MDRPHSSKSGTKRKTIKVPSFKPLPPIRPEMFSGSGSFLAPFHLPHRMLRRDEIAMFEKKNTLVRLKDFEKDETNHDARESIRSAEVNTTRKTQEKRVSLNATAENSRKGSKHLSMTKSVLSIPEEAPKKQPPPETDLNDLIENTIKKFTDNNFVYLKYSVSQTSEFFTPYSLVVAPYSQIDKTQFYTISRNGVTFWGLNEQNFTKLDEWQKEYTLYCKIRKISIFYNFHKWKSFKVWRKIIKWKKFLEAKKYLTNHLFIATPALAKTILLLRADSCNLIKEKFVDMKNIEDWQLLHFYDAQLKIFEILKKTLLEFWNDSKKKISSACSMALLEKGFSPTDEAKTAPYTRKLRQTLTFTERAKKRRYCKLLSNFLTYCDYLIITTLHKILKNTFRDLVDAFKIHEDLGPIDEDLEGIELDKEIESERPSDKPQHPFFTVELVLKPNMVEIDPAEELMFNIMEDFMSMIEGVSFEIKRFTNDPHYLQYTEPSIMGRQEERLAGEPPDFNHVLKIDEEYQNYRKTIHEIIHNAYQKTYIYIKRYESIRLNYEIDVDTDVNTIKEETELDTLRRYCERYKSNMYALNGILPAVKLGLLNLKQGTFKEAVTPVCKGLMGVLETHVPELANDKVRILYDKAQELMAKITLAPTITTEFVNYLRFLNETGKEIEEFFKEVDYAHDCFVLMKDFSIPVREEDKERYMDCEELVIQCKEMLEKKKFEKPIFVNKLNDYLQEDIKGIFEEVHEISEEVQNSKYINESLNPEDIKIELISLMERLKQCQELAHEYRSYQKEFKMEITRYDELERVMQEVRMRQNLWSTIEEWNVAKLKWENSMFNTLNTEELIETTGKTLKNCTQFEKYLPQNALVPKLRESAEQFKDKLPIIGYLRNPSLKGRHWVKIEQIINKKVYQEKDISLETFETAGAFNEENSKALMEISSQASAEGGLENMLKKVEGVWKETELLLVPHRNSLDSFILAGVDELQIQWDESNVIINTIAASRHCAPIKTRVNEWVEQLDLFSSTLEEWLACQRSWIYLEAIFSAPDIQRQLPEETHMFSIVDKSWKEITRNAKKIGLAILVMTDREIFDAMKQNNMLLESVTRFLEAYLEVKRKSFPRFYFLSNDELLEILAQTRNPHAVQPHLRKCFDAIAKLEFGTKEAPDGKLISTNEIIAMISPEGERVTFGGGLKARGAVEDWLGKVEEAMFAAMRRCMKFGYQRYPLKERWEWFKEHPSQVVLTVSQQQWSADVHKILDNFSETNILKEMKIFEKKCLENLSYLAAITRTELPPVQRKILCALITIDVHARDIISSLIEKDVVSSSDFNWTKTLRYYWLRDRETMVVHMASAQLKYYYEYLGASGVLVITPLTDRCYLCLTGALQMNLGGAPAGPAGTGKTETTKDLAKALAKQCVVFNCSEGLDYTMMGRFFSGLAQSGAWCCFDEFNRIDIEVLSVIAQQLITIRNAKSMRLKQFMFEGREIPLNPSCAVFITMNPGYAGRTELPDNLKSLFRPISMMVPDYALISEVILYSEGFEEPRLLAHKMVQMYKLCSEQLSQQNHYDFGMRAVKSVLVMAGSLKRSAPNQAEDTTLIAALRDSNLPKFLADDSILFKGILGDLFPGVELPEAKHTDLERAFYHFMAENNLQPLPAMTVKCIQLFETMCVRWGVMLVGPTGGGKTTILRALAGSLDYLFNDEIKGPYYRPVNIKTLNPKSITVDELYGYTNQSTLEWKDGLLGLAVREAVSDTYDFHQWIVCDGPVDAVWIENLNTVLDDNKMLCLANSERIKLTPWVHMLFEVEDLAQASPATVSRCGMVYIDPGELGWRPFIKSWLDSMSENVLKDIFKTELMKIFDNYFEKVLNFAHETGRYQIRQVTSSKVTMTCQLLSTLIDQTQNINLKSLETTLNILYKYFVWAMMWSLGGNFLDESRQELEAYIRKLLEQNDALAFPEYNLWDYRINTNTYEWERWLDVVEPFVYDPQERFFNMLVPTSVTTKFGFIAELLFKKHHPVLFTGDSGVGKSVLAMSTLKKLSEVNYVPVSINFSAQTSSKRTQEMIEARLEKRRKGQVGAPVGKAMIVFIDDVNMPKLDTYGSQPPIELLRQFLDFKGFYDREKLFWKEIVDVVLGAACAPPGGGRNPLTPRFLRHFAVLSLPAPNRDTLSMIFGGILNGFFNEFNHAIQALAKPIVTAGVDMYERIANELLPTPNKSHYVFNLRDLSKCIQGVLQADATNYANELQVLRLFYHESLRVFSDRLINDTDKTYFKQLMDEVCLKHFEKNVVKEDELVMFGDFMVFGQATEERIYEEINDIQKLESILMDYLDDYNTVTGSEMKLILFQDAIEHTIRLARLLRAERGNGLLVGVSGMGKQSLTKLAAHVNAYTCSQIELTRTYDISAFHEDLRSLYEKAGIKSKPTVFVIVDTQIVKEEFLEDINNILNSGDVPNLFEGDDYEQIIIKARDLCCNEKIKDCSRDEIYKFFIDRVKANLHIVICMSPIGDAFRRRCRMFPSLVNCCTIDWFTSWPSEALYSVAVGLLEGVSDDKKQIEDLARVSVYIHKTVEEASKRFYDEMKRYYYTTPSGYLELLKLYQNLLKSRSDMIIAKRKRISNGLDKILETNTMVTIMQNDLTKLAPLLEEQSASMKLLLDKLEIDTKAADTVKEAVAKDETVAKDKAAACQAIADDAAKDLEIAMPALRSAEEALKGLNKTDMNELRAFASPPRLVQFVMEAVCILLGTKPTWASAKGLMADVNFLKRLVEFDKEHIPEVTLKKLKKYVEHKDFSPARIEKVSKVAKSVSLWVIAIDKFAKVYKVVEPKIRKHEAAESELKDVMAVLRAKQQQLAEVEAQIQVLRDKIEEKQMDFRRIQDNVNLTTARINRAARLTSALADEEIRWADTVKVLGEELKDIPGDVLIASACVAYLGAFSIKYRRDLCQRWIVECKKYEIPSSNEFNMISILGDAYEMRNWNTCGLPKDEISIENGLFATRALRWPLMIDPQEQANRWIRNLEQPNGLKIVKITEPLLLRILETCIRQGEPILIEDIEETIDPALNPVLQRLVFTLQGRKMIKLGDTAIDYNSNFRLYMTTKLSNPHYLPEICITVTLVNFMVTVDGLENQLLADVVAIELPDLEKQRSDLVVKINADRQQLLFLEDKVLKLLFSSQGNILDDEELVNTLNEAKETSLIIANRLVDTEETESMITATREKYRTLAARGAILYFVVASLAEIDPMYQYSLKYFTQIFCGVLHVEHEKTSIEIRTEQLKDEEVEAIFKNISRGLFERHKLIFSFLLATAIEKQEERISEEEYNYLLRGPTVAMDIGSPPDTLNFLSEQMWKNASFLEKTFANFEGLSKDLMHKIVINIGSFREFICLRDDEARTETNWTKKLTSFQKLMLIKSFKKEKLVPSIVEYIIETLGKSFTEASDTVTLRRLYEDTTNKIPLVFILSTGSDPMDAVLKFVKEMNYHEKFYSISLGQGQGKCAENLVIKCQTLGHWIFLQNCHLATSWMETLEIIVQEMVLETVIAHTNFRLFLSSMPTKSFPISVLQNSVKVTNEPPKGLKANLARALTDVDVDFFEHHVLDSQWRAMVFGACMFHGVILERRKFGPLGWNILYEFNESDRNCGLQVLSMLTNYKSVEPIPWDSILYMNAEIIWGGRVTDYWDQRCLRSLMKVFLSPAVVEPDYVYGSSGVYRDPRKRKIHEYQEYVSSLPFEDEPEVFGMHENASLVYQTKETDFIISTLLEGQPRLSGGQLQSRNEQICLDIVEQINAAVTSVIRKDLITRDLLQVDASGRIPSMTTVLIQEVDRYNHLLKIIHTSLSDLRKAIKGSVLMSDSSEQIFNAFLNNTVPNIWSKAGFLSIKTLPNWIPDIQRRLDFLQNWCTNGIPPSVWLSGFFFPQSFLTGMLQTHARRYGLAIDSLKIDFEVLKPTLHQNAIYEAHQRGEPDSPELYEDLQSAEVGAYVHGLFIEAGRWDLAEGGLSDPFIGELYSSFPVVWFKPCIQLEMENRYEAPLFKTQARAGVLSTTGHSTNFVLAVLLNSLREPDFWILRGTALVTTVAENIS